MCRVCRVNLSAYKEIDPKNTHLARVTAISINRVACLSFIGSGLNPDLCVSPRQNLAFFSSGFFFAFFAIVVSSRAWNQ